MGIVIAITGGIGAGKSVVSEILRCEGFHVYDCDQEAKILMSLDETIMYELRRQIHPDAVLGKRINRKLISDIAFSDERKLNCLNKIVHGAVKKSLCSWINNHREEEYLFVETAILYQSGLDSMVDIVWEVTAPVDVRISRVMARNSLDKDSVIARIKAQDSFIPSNIHSHVIKIVNDGTTPILPRIKHLLSIKSS